MAGASMARAISTATARRHTSSPRWRTSCRTTRSGSPATSRARGRPRRPSWRPTRPSHGIGQARRGSRVRRAAPGRMAGPRAQAVLCRTKSRHAHALVRARARACPRRRELRRSCRARAARRSTRFTAEHRGRDIIAVTHGGTIRAALTLALRARSAGGAELRRRELLAHPARFHQSRRVRPASGVSAPSTTAPGARAASPRATSGVLG